jgi:hypothetical protein
MRERVIVQGHGIRITENDLGEPSTSTGDQRAAFSNSDTEKLLCASLRWAGS